MQKNSIEYVFKEFHNLFRFFKNILSSIMRRKKKMNPRLYYFLLAALITVALALLFYTIAILSATQPWVSPPE
jgi:hypothetical protein